MTNDDTPKRPWAVLAYTVADDKSSGGALDRPAQKELKAICDAADFGRLRVAAQVDFKSAPGVFRAVLEESEPRAFEDIDASEHPLWRSIEAKLARSKLRVQKEQVDLNAARGRVLKTFLRYGHRECAADRYLVSFYGHAYGPMGLFYDNDQDGPESTSLGLSALANSLEAVDGRAAVLVFRNCLVNTLETAYEVRDVAQFMVATQALAPISGVWPWKFFATALMPGAPSGDVATAIAQQLSLFLEAPENRGSIADVPYTAIDLDAADAIVEPLNALAGALESARGDRQRESACARALEGARMGHTDTDARPGDPAIIDVPTMCRKLGALAGDPVEAPAKALEEIVRTRLVRWHGSRGNNYHGISVYYQPTGENEKRSCIFYPETEAADKSRYRKLALSRASNWHRIALAPLAT